MKQAKTIYKVAQSDCDTYFPKDFSANSGGGDIRESISEDKANALHQQWKALQDKYDEKKKELQEKKDAGTLVGEAEIQAAELFLRDDPNGANKDEWVNDQLFIYSDEDVQDIFEAFKIYKMPGFWRIIFKAILN